MLRQHEIEASQAKPVKVEKEDDAPVEELLEVDKLSIQVGSKLIKTVDPRRKSSLSHRISPLRRKFAQEYGIILPLVRLRDNVLLDPNRYEIRLYNHVISSGRLEPDKLLAMDPGTVGNEIQGQPAVEPVFNLPALWIDQDLKEQAELRGYTVVDPESVLVTHLSESLKKHSHELLTRDDVQLLVDRLAESQPTLVKEVVGDTVTLGLLQRVLQNLLRENLPIRDLTQILEVLGDHATKTRDPKILTELARKAMVRTITEQHRDINSGKIMAISLDPSLEYELCSNMGDDGSSSISVAPERALELGRSIAEAWRRAMEAGLDRAVLLCDYRLRSPLSGMLSRQLPQLPVLAYDEISTGTQVESVASISLQTTARTS
jgi:flagellar biosynthesis protein FlhA